MKRRIDLALLAAMPREIESLTDRLDPFTGGSVGGESYALGTHQNRTVLVGTLGFGKVNAAATVAALAQQFDLSQVWHIGCAGAYTQGMLDIGDVLITTEFICGDEGILNMKGELPQSGIGIPIVVANGHGYHDILPADQELLAWSGTLTPAGRYRMALPSPQSGVGACQAIFEVGTDSPTADGSTLGEAFQIVYGPSLTVSLVSGDDTIAQERSLRFRALAENMEGSAVAQTCLRFGIPILECRGISNRAGDRRKERWRMELAIAHCHAVIWQWLAGSSKAPCGESPS